METAKSPQFHRLSARGWQARTGRTGRSGEGMWPSLASSAQCPQREQRGTQAGKMLIFSHMLLLRGRDMPFVKQQEECMKGL